MGRRASRKIKTEVLVDEQSVDNTEESLSLGNSNNYLSELIEPQPGQSKLPFLAVSDLMNGDVSTPCRAHLPFGVPPATEEDISNELKSIRVSPIKAEPNRENEDLSFSPLRPVSPAPEQGDKRKLSPSTPDSSERASAPPKKNSKLSSQKGPEEEDPTPSSPYHSYYRSPTPSPSYSPKSEEEISAPPSPQGSPKGYSPSAPIPFPPPLPIPPRSSLPQPIMLDENKLMLLARLVQKEDPSLPPIAPNGSLHEQEGPSNDAESYLEEAPKPSYGPTFMLVPHRKDMDEITVRTFCENAGLAKPLRVGMKKGKLHISWENMEHYQAAVTSPVWHLIGTVLTSQNPLRAGGYNYLVYFAGEGIANPQVRDRFTALLVSKGIEVEETRLSSKGTFLVVSLASLEDLTKLVENPENDELTLPPSNMSELSRKFLAKKSLTYTDDPSIRPIKVTRVPAVVDGRLIIGIRKIAHDQDDRVLPEDVVCFLPQTKKGSKETTPYAILWVRSKEAFDYFMGSPKIRVRNAQLAFANPDPFVQN